MPTVFADAGYWIAMWNPRDSLHDRARAITQEIGPTDYVTTQMVLTETLDSLAGMGEFSRTFAAQEVLALVQDPSIEIIEQTDPQFQDALQRYAARADQRWGMTDCASFLVMEQRNITQALAYDRDFEQAGFTALLRDARA